MKTLLFKTQEQIDHIMKMDRNSEVKLTVRRGCKWNYNEDMEIRVEEEGTYTSIAFGDVIYTKLKKFSECKEEILSSHFMFFDYEQELQHLKSVYKDFTEDEIITLVYFKIK